VPTPNKPVELVRRSVDGQERPVGYGDDRSRARAARRRRGLVAHSRRGTPEIGPLTVERYETVDLATGQRTVFHLAGDVVLAAGVELESLDAPPTFPRGVRGEAGPNGRRGVVGNLVQPLDRSRRQRVA